MRARLGLQLPACLAARVQQEVVRSGVGVACAHFRFRRAGHRGTMLIKVKTLTGKEIEIDIEPTDKVERIKERVEEKEGIPPQQQRLIYSGKQMNDEKTAADYKIQGGSVLHLVLALRGGGARRGEGRG